MSFCCRTSKMHVGAVLCPGVAAFMVMHGKLAALRWSTQLDSIINDIVTDEIDWCHAMKFIAMTPTLAITGNYIAWHANAEIRFRSLRFEGRMLGILCIGTSLIMGAWFLRHWRCPPELDVLYFVVCPQVLGSAHRLGREL